MIALAVLDQILQRVAQAGQFGNLLIQRINMLVRQCLHIAAGALAVLPEGQQLADFFQRKPKVTRAFDKRQGVQVVVAVKAVAAVTATGGFEQADGLVITNHLGAQAAVFGGLADIHDSCLLIQDPWVSRI